MHSAIKQSAENNLHMRVMTAKAKIIARTEATAHEFEKEFPGALTNFRATLMAEAEAKANAKTEKESLIDYIPSWMNASRWTTGERRKIAKITAYGLKRVTRADGYSEDRTAHEENRPYNKDPRPMWKRADRRTA